MTDTLDHPPNGQPAEPGRGLGPDSETARRAVSYPDQVGDPIPPPPPPPSAANTVGQMPFEPPSRPPTDTEVSIREAVERELRALGAGLVPAKAAKAPRRLKFARLPDRYKFAGAVIGTTVVVGLTLVAVTPKYPSPDGMVATATISARAAAAQETRAELEKAKSEATQIVVPEAFGWSALPLTDTAKQIISYQEGTNGKILDYNRAAYVEKQVFQRMGAGATQPSLRLIGQGVAEIRVTQIPTEGVALFGPAPTAPLPSSTATTPTSAGGS